MKTLGPKLNEWEEQIKLPSWTVVCLKEVNSTMDTARELCSSLQGPAVVLVQNQLCGRGRHGRSWQAAEKGFYATFIFPATAPLSTFVGYSLVVGVILQQKLQQFGVPLQLKWPNDLINEKGAKLGGILLEIYEVNDRRYMLCGIGLNLRGEPKVEYETCSVFSISGLELNQVDLIINLAQPLLDSYKNFVENGFKPFLSSWIRVAAFVNSEITLDTGSEKLKGTFLGLSDNGCMLLQVDGKCKEIASGHILTKF